MSSGWIHPLRLHAEPARVVVRPFHLSLTGRGTRKSRLEGLVDDIRALNPEQVQEELSLVLADFGSRHWQIEDVFDQRFNQVAWQLKLDPAGTDWLKTYFFSQTFTSGGRLVTSNWS